MIRKFLYTALLILNILLSLTAIPGGFCLLTGIAAPPVTALNGSIFSDYTLPGLALMLVVGGSALVAAVMLIHKYKYALFYSATVGLIIMTFEFVEVLAVGTPTGAGLAMQIIYFLLGVLLVKWSMFVLYLDMKKTI